LRDADAKIAALAAEIEKLRAAIGKQPVQDKRNLPQAEGQDKQSKLAFELDLQTGKKQSLGKDGTPGTYIDLLGDIKSLNDLLELGQRYIEAQGDAEYRRKVMELVDSLPKDDGAIRERQLAQLRRELSLAERRARLLRAALESLCNAAEKSVETARRELEAARQAADSSGDVAALERKLLNAEATLQLLHAMLEP